MQASLIVAVAKNRVIGKDNTLIWHLPRDLKYFKEKTLGHHVIMGRKNFESIPEKFRPLVNRKNIIITRQTEYKVDGCIIVNSLKKALKIAKKNGDTEPFIIGGGQIYKAALEQNLVNKIYLTKVYHSFDGDTFFPELSENWKEINIIKNKADEKHNYNYDFITLEKN